MLATTLRYDYEVRDEAEVFKATPSPRVSKEMVSLAGHILDSKAGHFDASRFTDENELALRKLVKRKAAGRRIEPPREREETSNVVDLMQALRSSLKGRKAAALRASNAKERRSKLPAKRRKAS